MIRKCFVKNFREVSKSSFHFKTTGMQNTCILEGSGPGEHVSTRQQFNITGVDILIYFWQKLSSIQQTIIECKTILKLLLKLQP
jgi:hypothetical protein